MNGRADNAVMTLQPGKPKSQLARAEKAIAECASSYPEVVEETPWGHRAFKIRGKTFLFLGADAAGLSFSVKLPVTGEAALALTFTEPTHYGLGKSGWVTASFGAEDDVPLGLVEAWVAESFRAIAPKKVVASLAGAPQGKAAAAPRVKAKKGPALSEEAAPSAKSKAKAKKRAASPERARPSAKKSKAATNERTVVGAGKKSKPTAKASAKRSASVETPRRAKKAPVRARRAPTAS